MLELHNPYLIYQGLWDDTLWQGGVGGAPNEGKWFGSVLQVTPEGPATNKHQTQKSEKYIEKEL